MMRAAVVKTPGPAESLVIADVPDPSPGQDELSIDVEFAGVGFVDTLFRGGAFTLPVPFIPGIEVTGRVRAVGPGVTGFTPGQPVGAPLNDFGRAARAGGYGAIAVAHVSMTVALPGTADLALIAGVLVNGVTAWMALHDLARLMASTKPQLASFAADDRASSASHPARRKTSGGASIRSQVWNAASRRKTPGQQLSHRFGTLQAASGGLGRSCL